MTYTTLNNSYLNNPQLLNPNTSNISHTNNLKDKEKERDKNLIQMHVNINEENTKLNSELDNLKHFLSQLNNENKELRKENQILIKKANIENPFYLSLSAQKDAKQSLYESLVIYLKNINLVHSMEVYQLNLQREEEIRKILESKNIPGIQLINDQIYNLNNNFIILRGNCEQALREYHLRSKSYIAYEVFENKILENKNFTENILNLVLSKFFEKKDARNDMIFFKFEHNEYNQIIEDLTSELESFHKKEFGLLESYKKNLSLIDPAIEVLAKQTILESEKLNIIFNDPNYKLI